MGEPSRLDLWLRAEVRERLGCPSGTQQDQDLILRLILVRARTTVANTLYKGRGDKDRNRRGATRRESTKWRYSTCRQVLWWWCSRRN